MPGRAVRDLRARPRADAGVCSRQEEESRGAGGEVLTNLIDKKGQVRENRRKAWPPLLYPNRCSQLAEPRNLPDRAEVLRKRIAEVDSLHPAGTNIADARLATRSRAFAPEWPSVGLDAIRDARRWMVNTVCRKRSAAIQSIEDVPSPAGRLLVFDVDETLVDGASEAVSDGYFDFSDEPGWNTWIDYYEDPERTLGARLLCYVPPPLIELADHGAVVSAARCFRWIDCPELIRPS